MSVEFDKDLEWAIRELADYEEVTAEEMIVTLAREAVEERLAMWGLMSAGDQRNRYDRQQLHLEVIRAIGIR